MKKTSYYNYQEYAREFSVGDKVVFLLLSDTEQAGRVTAVYPAIGMVDVQFPTGNVRVPVEELQIVNQDLWVRTPSHETTPGGQGTVLVPGGPPSKSKGKKAFFPSNQRNQKQGLYWTAQDRKYKATKIESEGGNYFCPRCKDSILKRCVYKRQGGISERLLGCKSCLFLIKNSDIDRNEIDDFYKI